MSRQTILARGRARLAEALIDTCLVERVTGETTNLTTGAVTKTYTTVYSGACRVQAATANWAGPADVGQAAIRLAAAELQLPVVGSEGILIDDRVSITACVHDTDMVGRVYSVTGLSHKSEATTRKLPLQEILS
jgi:hypothetical protein